MLELFGVTFHLYGVFIALAIGVSIFLTEKILKTQRISLEIEAVSIWVIGAGLIGARLYHVATDWHLYADNLWSMFFIWQGGLGIIGAIIGGGVGLFLALVNQKKKQYFLTVIESIVITVPLAQAIGRWGNYFNQELFGTPTQLPWGIFIPEQYRSVQFQSFDRFHPLFLYESMLCLLLFGLLYLSFTRGKLKIGEGQILGGYLVGYSMIRFSLEFLRIESARFSGLFHFLTIAQWIMIGVCCIGIYFFISRKSHE